eukprot:scaffold3080_cov171-Skeletonema_dohrnii-CCMP3373.AAC.8
MVWGLLPNNGTPQSPHLLPSDVKFTPSPHYIMFNARSETVDAKKSFHSLLRDGQSCIFAVDGYYEWTKSLSPIDKRKQPYFVKSSSSDTQSLLLAGLWTFFSEDESEDEVEAPRRVDKRSKSNASL